MDPQGLNNRLEKARASLDGFIDSIIDEHMQKKKPTDSVETDMVDELLAFYSDEAIVTESEDLQNSIKLTRDNIKAIIMDVMFGGTETVASAIDELDMDDIFGLTAPRATRLKAVPSPRLLCQLC
ncbi:cytochrome P450 84A1-like [Olea europaea subsp. europaea]|uniref:Cytochrome P450 84A1-like n=1 Tax=Olea europaea subsp. europaea TaxID=158383 RepID=A0A8S0UFE6_OLEEU|nr:cytochrome P450 84A1-like [Olea europaea subsp. europaea]